MPMLEPDPKVITDEDFDRVVARQSQPSSVNRPSLDGDQTP
jgi:hypothetical protein